MIDVANLASRFLSLCRFCIFYEPWANGSSLIQVWAGVYAEQAMSAELSASPKGLVSAEDGDHDSNPCATVLVSRPSHQMKVIAKTLSPPGTLPQQRNPAQDGCG